MLVGCSTSEEDRYYQERMSSFAYEQNTYILLEKQDESAADIAISANNDYALVSISYKDKQVDQYYEDTKEYVYLKGFADEDLYYYVPTEVVFADPMDIFNRMVFDPSDISNIKVVETITEDGKELIHLQGKISSQDTHFYLNKDDETINKVVFRDGSTLIFKRQELVLPEGFADAKQADAELINQYMEQISVKEN